MITQDEEMLNECLELIKAFKNHLSIINADYLSKHIIGIIRKGVVRYRDPDNNWYYKNFCADIDNVTKDLIGIDKQTGHYLVSSTNFRDYYLNDLINSMLTVPVPVSTLFLFSNLKVQSGRAKRP